MSLPAPYQEADDRTVVEGCLTGDGDGWKALEARYGRLIEAVVVRVVDERRGGPLEEVPLCCAAVLAQLRANEGDVLRRWDEESTLRHFLAAFARAVTQSYLQDVTPPASLIAKLPTPAALFLDDVVAIEPARQVSEALERQEPHIVGMVRLRLRDVDRATIGVVLGLSAATVTSNLEKVAERVASLMDGPGPDLVAAWSMLLDALPIDQRVGIALRTERDPEFRRVRSLATSTWKAMRERVLHMVHPKDIACLDERTSAAFVDGSLKGAERTRAEGHIAGCARCIDAVATLAMDMRTIDALQLSRGKPPRLALAAACVATTRFRVGELLGTADLDRSPHAASIVRIARIGQSLVSGYAEGLPPESSRVVATKIPSDDEAPLVAFEALIADDAHTALRAIDDIVARGILGGRLRLLAAAMGDDPKETHDLANSLEGQARSDPGLKLDLQAVRALPPGRSLPREIVVERLRDCIPGAVRFALSRRASSDHP
ncbi:MAG: hypothetical protein AAGF12_27980 [Myxococcota bacterium]